MDILLFVLITGGAALIGFAVGIAGDKVPWFQKPKESVSKRKRKRKTTWLTWHQCSVLDSIAQHGGRGVLLWYTDISLATIRSLAKRGFVDTRSGNRVIATRAGKRRLLEPWPTQLGADAPKVRPDPHASGGAEIAPAASEGEAAVGKIEQTG